MKYALEDGDLRFKVEAAARAIYTHSNSGGTSQNPHSSATPPNKPSRFFGFSPSMFPTILVSVEETHLPSGRDSLAVSTRSWGTNQEPPM